MSSFNTETTYTPIRTTPTSTENSFITSASSTAKHSNITLGSTTMSHDLESNTANNSITKLSTAALAPKTPTTSQAITKQTSNCVGECVTSGISENFIYMYEIKTRLLCHAFQEEYWNLSSIAYKNLSNIIYPLVSEFF